jgi:hypothetical protein
MMITFDFHDRSLSALAQCRGFERDTRLTEVYRCHNLLSTRCARTKRLLKQRSVEPSEGKLTFPRKEPAIREPQRWSLLYFLVASPSMSNVATVLP